MARVIVHLLSHPDRDVPMLSTMFKNRLRSYRAIGYTRDETPLGLKCDGDHETVVEYDGQALPHFDEEE
jgi:hypothetical protein